MCLSYSEMQHLEDSNFELLASNTTQKTYREIFLKIKERQKKIKKKTTRRQLGGKGLQIIFAIVQGNL